MNNGIKIGELAARYGVSRDTVRFYERPGLLRTPRRTAARHRRYDREPVVRLRFIRGAQRLGLTLDDIRQLLRLRELRSPKPASESRIGCAFAPTRSIKKSRSSVSLVGSWRRTSSCARPLPHSRFQSSTVGRTSRRSRRDQTRPRRGGRPVSGAVLQFLAPGSDRACAERTRLLRMPKTTCASPPRVGG